MRHKQQDTRQATGKGIVIHGDTVPFFCLLAAMRGGAGSSGSGYDCCYRLV